jgi:putative ABC transport system permease protein
MKAIGAEDRQLTLLFLIELAGLGLLCGVSGYGAGLALAQLIGNSLFNSPIAPRPAVFAAVIGLTLAVAVVSGLLPIKRMRQVEPAIILKGD